MTNSQTVPIPQKVRKIYASLLRWLDLEFAVSNRARCALASARGYGTSTDIWYDGGLEVRLSHLLPKFLVGRPIDSVDARYLVASVDVEGFHCLTVEPAIYDSKTNTWIWSTQKREHRDDDLWITPTEHHDAVRAAIVQRPSLQHRSGMA